MPSEIPWAVSSPQENGRQYERQQAKTNNARLHPASGSIGSKGDYSTEDTVFEQKVVRDSKSHSINGKRVNDLLTDALAQGKDAVYTIYFEEYNLTIEGHIRRGK